MLMSITIEELANFVEQLANRFDTLENIVTDLANVRSAAPTKNDSATPRIEIPELVAYERANPGSLAQDRDDDRKVNGKSITGPYGYDVSDRPITVGGQGLYKDSNTGLPCYWVTSANGKRFLVDVVGVPMFLHNPVREEAYASLFANNPELANQFETSTAGV